MAPSLERRPGTPRPRRYPLGTGEVVAADLGPFALEAGGASLPLTLAYRHDGPGPDAPQVLVIHALTGSADAAGDWWSPLIGPGRAFDTTRVGVLCANLLGGRYGSTGPTSVDPSTGRAWGRTFPAVSARDEARALWVLADALGIERFALATGGSLGGMIALEVALERPRLVDRAVPIAAPAAIGGLAIAWNHIQLELIERLGDEGLALARQLAMTTYRSEADFDSRFGRAREADGRFSVASYLDHQGDKLLDRFDPDTYRVLVGVMDRHDIGRDRGGIDGRAGRHGRRGRRAHRDRHRGRHPVWAGPGPVARRHRRRRRGRRHLPRARFDQGPRRVPDRVGPADAPAGRGACRRRRAARLALSHRHDRRRGCLIALTSALAAPWRQVEPTVQVRQTAIRILRVHPLRAADARQPAAAVVAAAGDPGTLPFVTLDDRLALAARREGFPIVMPT